MSRSTLTIYFPQKHQESQVLERLQKIAARDDRSVNYLAVQAVLDFLEREENQNPTKSSKSAAKSSKSTAKSGQPQPAQNGGSPDPVPGVYPGHPSRS